MVASCLGCAIFRFVGVSISRRPPIIKNKLSRSCHLCVTLKGAAGIALGTKSKPNPRKLVSIHGGSCGLKSFRLPTESRVGSRGLSVQASLDQQSKKEITAGELRQGGGNATRHTKVHCGNGQVVESEGGSQVGLKGVDDKQGEAESASWAAMSETPSEGVGLNEVAEEAGKQPDATEGLDDQAAKRRRMNDGGAQAKAGGSGEAQDGGGNEKGRGKRKRNKTNRGPPNEFIKAIHMAAKHCDAAKAMAAFRGAKAAGVTLNQDTMNSLLYILVGGDKWSDHARSGCERVLEGRGKQQADASEGGNAGSEPEGACEETLASDIPAAQDDFRNEVFQYMEDGKMLNSEMAFTAQSRLAACYGDASQAYEFVEKMLGQNIPGKLRMFTPALVCYATLGNAEGALKVEKRIKSQNLDLTELEFRLLLEACATSGTYEQIATLLTSIGKERTFLEDSTVQHIIRYFKSDRAEAAFAKGAPFEGKQMWAVKHVDVQPDGYCDMAGGKVAPIDLEEADWGKFLEGVKKIAVDREKNNAFANFLNWLGRNGPFDIIVDGANVAMHGQNFEGAFFRFNQIECLMRMLAEEFPQRRALVILHVGRLHGGPAKDPKAKLIINNLASSGQLYSTPIGSNDDWYWLYAAIKAKGNGLVVSNDECRDHIFQLLAPKYFLKWKERHLVRFGFHKERYKGLTAEVKLPAPYTPCTQQLCNGTWMIPCVGGKWLCVKAL